MDIFVRRARGSRACDCPSAGEAAIQTIAVHHASVSAYGPGREPIPAKAARPADLAASLRNNCLDCHALCSANVAHQAQAGTNQEGLLPGLG